jgi:hypothetical protein
VALAASAGNTRRGLDPVSARVEFVRVILDNGGVRLLTIG